MVYVYACAALVLLGGTGLWLLFCWLIARSHSPVDAASVIRAAGESLPWCRARPAVSSIDPSSQTGLPLAPGGQLNLPHGHEE